MYKVKLKEKCATHRERQPDGTYKDYSAGDVFVSPHNLAKTFREKFEDLGEVHTPPPAESPASANKSSPDVPTPGDPLPPSKRGLPKNLGENVSEQFPEAADAELLVFRTANNRYNIVDPDSDSLEPINKKPLAKNRVKSAISRYVDDGDEEDDGEG